MSAPAAPPAHRLEELRSHVRSLEAVLVCFSGGIDSALLLAVAHEQLGPKGIGLTAVSPSLAESERLDAQRIAAQLGAELRLVETHELERPEYARNESDRCFHCKTELYELAERCRLDWGLSVVVNGSNLDDLGDYRPGLEAAKIAKVRSPLLELGFSKADVRAAALALGLDVWDKPASACLSSRLPYGTPVTRERLAQIGQLEAALKGFGLRQLRVRWHERIARIEVELSELPRLLEPELRQQILEAGKAAGFTYVTLDLGGYRQGSHNDVLIGRNLKLI